jgi:hypothetical protein
VARRAQGDHTKVSVEPLIAVLAVLIAAAHIVAAVLAIRFIARPGKALAD